MRLLLSAFLLIASTAQAQTLPLVQASDLTLAGTINLPGDGLDYGGGAIAFSPARHSLFTVGWAGSGYAVGEFSIPAFGQTASVLQPFRDIWDGRRGDIGVADNRVGGLLVVGDRLVSSIYAYYDAGYVQTRSHFTRSTILSASGSTGPVQVGARNPGYYSGYMAEVPAEHRSAIGATHVTGNCCLSILSRTSYGPALFAFDPTAMRVTGDLVWYDGAHPLRPYAGTGPAEPVFNGNTKIYGVCMPPGTGSVLFFGTTGLGPRHYGDGAERSEPYSGYVWAYRVSDLVAVKNGQREAWSVQPYATWTLPWFVAGATCDHATKRVYLVEPRANGTVPVVRVLNIGPGTGTPPVVVPPVVVPPVTPPVQGATYRTDIEPKTCDLTVTADRTPDGLAGWGVQFQRNGVSHGTRDTSAPYTRTATVTAGSYALRAVWTKTGAASVTDTLDTRVCP